MVTLATDRFRLVLAPDVGGSIASFENLAGQGRAVPLLRGNHAPLSPLEAACFPLVPYCNRIRDGRFWFRGQEVVIAPNMAGDPSPLHGQGWLTRWQVAAVAEDRAELAYDHDAGEWPWRYTAMQRFVLDATGLSAELLCTNADTRPMPCGLGFHPYFPCDAGTGLSTGVAHVWTVDDKVLPVELIPATGRYDVRGGPVCGRDLDNGYDGWDGTAWIDGLPGLSGRLRMASTTARFFQLYSPPAGGLFVAEPVSHANAALNAPEDQWAELGLRILEPGETLRLDMRIDLVA